MSYLVVDAATDAILAECDSVKDLLLTVRHLQHERPQREVFAARHGERSGDLISTQSLVMVRPLGDTEGFAL